MGNDIGSVAWKKNRNLSALIVIRRSSAGQKDNTSAETQRRFCTTYANDLGLQWREENIFVITETAYVPSNRKQYRKIIKDALKAGIRHIIFYSSSREARNSVDLDWLEQIVREDKLVLHYADSRKVFYSGTSDSDWFSRDIDGVVNKQFSRELSTKIKVSSQTKIQKGIYPFKPPLGYVRVKQRDSKGDPIKGTAQLGIDQNEANVNLVRREFVLRAQGYSYDRIYKTIKEERLVPIELRKTYARSTITKRLRNRVYWGEVVDERTGKVYDGIHPKIIADDVLKRVEKVNDGNFDSIKRSHLYIQDAGYFRGLITCGHPECRLQITYDPKEKAGRNGKNRTYHYYRCTNTKGAHPKKSYISEDDLWRAVDLSVKPFAVSDELANIVANRLNAGELESKTALQKKLKGFQIDFEGMSEVRSRMVELLAHGRVSQRDYEHQIASLDQREQSIQSDKVKTEQLLSSIEIITAQDVRAIARNIEKSWMTLEKQEKAKILRAICASSTLDHLFAIDQLAVRFELKPLIQKLTSWAPMVGQRSKVR